VYARGIVVAYLIVVLVKSIRKDVGKIVDAASIAVEESEEKM